MVWNRYKGKKVSDRTGKAKDAKHDHVEVKIAAQRRVVVTRVSRHDVHTSGRKGTWKASQQAPCTIDQARYIALAGDRRIHPVFLHECFPVLLPQ